MFLEVEKSHATPSPNPQSKDSCDSSTFQLKTTKWNSSGGFKGARGEEGESIQLNC
jgi:hypothetical protein